MMQTGGTRPIVPSSRLALYVAALITLYVIRDATMVMALAGTMLLFALIVLRGASRPVPRNRWRAALLFIGWVFVMRVALDLVAGVSPRDPSVWLAAGRQTARVAVLGVGVIVFIAVTSAREVVDELEHSRLPRSARLLVMMVIQYPRVLRDRYEQIMEAQIARGADRPRTIVQRVAHGSALLLPVMQSELNAIGERAGLIHLRGLDLEVPHRAGEGFRGTRDMVVLTIAVAAIALAVMMRVKGR